MSLMAGWERTEYAPGGGDAFLSYAVFGVIPESLPLPKVAADIPDLDIRRFTATDHPEVMDSFLKGPDMARLREQDEALATLALAVSECALISVTVKDPQDLLYLRRIRHVVAALVDSGGCALLDGPTLKWWKPEAWRSSILAPAELSIRDEVVVHAAGDEALWIRTRGLRKFGRPDLSLRDVPTADRERAMEHCRALIDGLIAGRLIDGVTGDLNDTEFNNYRVEITWPDAQ